MILAGDIGGTKTLIALYERGATDGLRLAREASFPSRSYLSLEAILKEFLHGESIDAACFGVAGAVIDGKCHTTNLPWQLDEIDLTKAVSSKRVKLLNDLEAASYGMLFLKHEEIVCLNQGLLPRRHGNIAVIAAGTGLGEGFLYWDGRNHHPLASEGGHADFAPRTDQEIALLQELRKRFNGHVSYERILSGPGFENLYLFLRDTAAQPESPTIAAEISAAKNNGADPSPIITHRGLEGSDPLCVATLDLFCEIYGAAAGNLALLSVAIGGVFIGGGIAPKILPALQKPGFMHAFTDKGRFHDLVKSMPVYVALNPQTGLQGAAHYALRQ
ncbi:MAG TPA: glucokinase [Gemmataceae bacterium]|jgi:glucokinase|nr:glucokinase [Gemmataceae bacterium]